MTHCSLSMRISLRSRQIGRSIRVVLLSTVVLTLSGCGEDGPDAAVNRWRSELLLESSPSGESPIEKVRKRIKGDNVEVTDTQVTSDGQADDTGELPEDDRVAGKGSIEEFVLLGRINAGDAPPWERGKAAFLLTDATGSHGDPDHNPFECPFCSRNIQDFTARVEFRDESGELVPVDSRELFDVSEDQVVLVRGTGSIDASDMLIVRATGIFVRR